MNDLTTEQLQALLADTDNTLTSLVDSLNSRSDIQNAIRTMMQAGSILYQPTTSRRASKQHRTGNGEQSLLCADTVG